MYTRLASALLDIGGESPRVNRFILEAAGQNPGSAAVRALVAQTRAFHFDAATGRVGKRNFVQPELAPRAARQMFDVVDLSAPAGATAWQAGETVTARDDQALSITTGSEPWAYAALIPLNFNDDWIHGGWYWAHLSMHVTAGQVGISIMMPGGALQAERLISAGSAPVDLVLPFVRTAGGILVRNGGAPGQSVVRLLDAKVRGIPISDDGPELRSRREAV